jgi:signal transduction histidine kinase
MTGPSQRRWAVGLALGLFVLVLSAAEWNQSRAPVGGSVGLYAFCVLLAIAVGALPLSPEVGLAAAWGAGLVQLMAGVPLLLTEAVLVAVIFVAARRGRVATAVLAAVTVLLAPPLAYVWLANGVFFVPSHTADVITRASYRYGWRAVIVVALVVLVAAWLAGLALRFLARAGTEREARARAERELDQAQEIARLRDEQTRLARDVHDVVGHSLAVILAQAESAQYVDDIDTTKLKQTMQTIATSARTSLQDVRQVLSSTQQSAARPGGLEGLIDGVRRSGHLVESTVVGRPQPLPPELEVVAYRVLQEMLTNALKHGRRDTPVVVERHWPDPTTPLGSDTLRLEVRNVADEPAETMPIATARAATTGRGLDGMRRRLEVVGGRFDVRRRSDGDAVTFTVTAWVPVRPVVG